MNRIHLLTTRHLLLVGMLIALLAGCNQEPSSSAPAPDPEQAKASILELAGTAWQLDFIGEPEADLTAIEGSRTILNFSIVNYFGSGGCNWYQGVYEASAPSLKLNPPFRTRLSCSEPPGIMDQEGTYMGAMLETTDYVLDEDKLVLFMNGDEQRLATFSPAEAVDFEGTLWGLKLYLDGQEWWPVIVQSEILGQFADGRLAGNAGCNDYTASFALDGPKIALTDLVATEETCSEPVEIMDQERIYLSNLESATRYEVTGGALTLFDEGGNPILYFGAQ